MEIPEKLDILTSFYHMKHRNPDILTSKLESNPWKPRYPDVILPYESWKSRRKHDIPWRNPESTQNCQNHGGIPESTLKPTSESGEIMGKYMNRRQNQGKSWESMLELTSNRGGTMGKVC